MSIVDRYQNLFEINLAGIKDISVSNTLVLKLNKYELILKEIDLMMKKLNLNTFTKFDDNISSISFFDNDSEKNRILIQEYINDNFNLRDKVTITFRQADSGTMYSTLVIKGAIKR